MWKATRTQKFNYQKSFGETLSGFTQGIMRQYFPFERFLYPKYLVQKERNYF